MNAMTDQTFITNENGQTLQGRFASLIKDTKFFDVLSGYFYSSGFKAIYPSLENTEKIRILVGISTDYKTYAAVKSAKELSSSEVGKVYSSSVKKELEDADDSIDTEESVLKFKEWLQSGRIEIKAYPDEKIHSKVYIMTFDQDDRDKGRVITGSSNFTESGLRGNIEFNVELKSRSDYDFALGRFEELWENGVDVSDQYIQTIDQDTWLNDQVTPYILYLKFLYEYFRDDINQEEDLSKRARPDNFTKLKYQEDAVLNAKRILKEHNGVFISDVVGLGKTYMGTMLCQELPGKTLVIAPPNLIEKNNPGSWWNAFSEFRFAMQDCRFESTGIIDKIAEKGMYRGYDNIIIDEAHKFRNEDTETYKHLNKICKNKRVILVTATPYNNSALDLLSQIKLFQKVNNSSIPNLPNIETFINKLEKKLKKINRIKNTSEYIEISKNNARLIRERLLKYIMVRRTRQEIEQWYDKDLVEKNVKFPTIAKPIGIYYQFDDLEREVFDKTLHALTQELDFSRYRPLDFLKDTSKLENMDLGRQKQLPKLMKILIVKRLESSYHAFKKTIDRFIDSYDEFIKQFKSGKIFISKKHFQRIADLIEKGEIESVNKIIEGGEADQYNSDEFSESFLDSLLADKSILEQIRDDWMTITTDSKLAEFKKTLTSDKNLINNKKIIFTESSETCDYLRDELDKMFEGRVFNFKGSMSQKDRERVIENFDNNYPDQKNDFDILITTDVLAEGVNLHRCNVVINYDLPWNPTKIMQRVGRINRVDTPHDVLYTYNIFPTQQSNEQIGLKESAEAKIKAFITLLGVDAQLLTDDEEIEAHSLFQKLNSKETIEGNDEGESELGYLKEIKKLREEDPNLFAKIVKMPRKSRAARTSTNKGLLTFFRDKRPFFFFTSKEKESSEIDFFEAAHKLKALPESPKGNFNKSYYDLLTINKSLLAESLAEEEIEINKPKGGRSNINALRELLLTKDIRHNPQYTDDQRNYIQRVIDEINSGGMTKRLAKEAYEEIKKPDIASNPIKLFSKLKNIISEDDLTDDNNQKDETLSKKEVILSEFYN